jgi:hypothetical protein
VILLIKANNSIPTIVDRYLASAMMAERAVQGAQLQEFSFGDVKDDVEAMAKKAVQAEASRGELSRTVRDYLRDQIGQGEFLEIKGRSYKMNKYAELVGRTTMRDAQTAATLDLCHQYENDLVQVSSHGTVCEICAQYEGKVYSISGKTPGYPMLERRTPFHPNCEHSMLPTSLEAILAEAGKLPPVVEIPLVALKLNISFDFSELYDYPGKKQLYTNRVKGVLKSLPRDEANFASSIKLVDATTVRSAYPGRWQEGLAGWYNPHTREIGLNIYFGPKRQVIAHEVAHAVWQRKLTEFQQTEMRTLWQSSKSGKIRPITKYSLTNSEEFFADNYGYYHAGSASQSKLDPVIKTWFDKYYGGH